MEELTPLLTLLNENRYWAAAALAVGLVMRLMKAHPVLAEQIPPRWRPTVVAALGLIAGALNSLESGRPLAVTMFEGLILAAGTAVLGHGLFIAGIRDGRELGARKGGEAPPPPAPPPDPPSTPRIPRTNVPGHYNAFGALALVALAAIGLAGCGLGLGAKACAVVDALEKGCAVIRYLGPDGGVEEVTVSRDELASFGRVTASARAARADGGAP